MPVVLGKCSKIRHIVRLRQMLRRWRDKARMSAGGLHVPADVPKGHVAVCVGSTRRRFIVSATYLNHPLFKNLLSQAEEEYGFTNQYGPLVIPCEESVFEETVRFISYSDSGRRFTGPDDDLQRNCHVGIRSKLDRWTESRPLLHGLTENTIW